MPRNVKESDDEWETKGGRRTRTMLGSSVLDSPLRRSSRIKQPAAQNDSSPDSNSDISSVGGTRNTRRRTIALDGATMEATRNLRTRRNSAASDISELAENDLPAESSGKRITRRSVAGLPTMETPTKLRATNRRITRAGSETKSTPPVGRVTRRTRASSMEPEVKEDSKIHDVGSPLKSKRRASALPSEPVVAEESEDLRVEKTVYEIDEDESDTAHETSKSSRRKSKGDANESDEKMDVDEYPVVGPEIETIEISSQTNTEESPSISQVPSKLDDSIKILDPSDNDENRENSQETQSPSSPVKGSSYTIENLLNKSTEVQEKSPGNKENESSNVSSGEKNINRSSAELPLSPRKSLNSSFAKITEKRSSISREDAVPSIQQDTKKIALIEEIHIDEFVSPKEVVTKKDYSLDAKCVVVIEPMDTGKIASFKGDFPQTPNHPQTLKMNEEAKDPLEIDKDVKEIEKTTEEVDGSRQPIETEETPNDKSVDAKIAEEPSATDPPTGEPTISEKPLILTEDNKCPENTEGTIVPEEIKSPDPSSMEVAEEPKRSQEHVEKTEATPEISKNSEPTMNRKSVSKSDEERRVGTTAIPSGENHRETIDIDTPKKSEANEEMIICEMVKDRKSSIVTESRSEGTIREEISQLSEVGVTEKSSARRISGKKSEDIRRKSIIEEADEFRVFDSDNDSETVACPSFKDIPADEWMEHSEEAKEARNDRDSIHSFSTERNESECELALVDKEPWQPSDTDKRETRRKNENSDSDDTVIARVEKKSKSQGDEKDEITEEPSNEEMLMNVSSDVEDRDETKKSKGSAKKRASLNNSENRGKDSPLSSNTSRRKSLLYSDDNSNDGTTKAEENPSNRSMKKSSRRKSTDKSIGQRESGGENEEEVDGNAAETPLSGKALRKSLAGSVKKIHDTSALDCSTPEKRKSLNKSVVSTPGIDGTPGNSKGSTSKGVPRKSYDNGNADSEIGGNGLDENSKISKTPLGKLNDSRSNRNSVNRKNTSRIEPRSLDSEAEGENDSESKLNQSSKSVSGRKSLNSKNDSKIEQRNSDSEIEEVDDFESKFNESSKSVGKRKSLNSKNSSRIEKESSDSEIEELNESSKSVTKRKSLNSKNSSRMQAQSSDPEIEKPNDSESKLNESSKSVTKRKSLNSRNTSSIKQRNSDSEAEEANDLDSKLDRSSKSIGNRKSLTDKNTSRIEYLNSDSEDGKENESATKLNRSSKSVGDRKSLSKKNTSKIEHLNSDSEDDEEKDLDNKLDRSSKSMGDRKSLSKKNTSRIEYLNLDSDGEQPNDSESKANRSSKSIGNGESMSGDSSSAPEILNNDSDVESRSNSDDEDDTTPAMPNFLLDANTSSDSDENHSGESIDSDIAREMNLAGESKVSFSDDDVQGDDCMETESESDDGEDDDGADLDDFVVNDDEVESSESSMSDEEDQPKPRKRIISCEEDDSDSVGSSDEEEDAENELRALKISFTSGDSSKTAKTPKKHERSKASVEDEEAKTPGSKSFVSTDTLEDDDENLSSPQTSKSSPDKSAVGKTPKKTKKLNDSLKITEARESVDLNESGRASAIRNKNIMLQSSTPKPEPLQNIISGKTNSAKSNRSARLEDSTGKLETSRKSSAEHSRNVENDTPRKLATSFKDVRTPKSTKSQLQTSLPMDLDESESKTNLSKVKSTKLSALHHTMITPNTDSPEKRFLMKEKLNDSLPALKLQNKEKELRRSILQNLRDGARNKRETIEEISGELEEQSICEETVEVDIVGPQKKKKKKKKKTKGANTSDLTEETIEATPKEDASTTNNTQESLDPEDTKKKSKKRKKNRNKSETVEMEEPSVHETEPIGKKSRKNEKSEPEVAPVVEPIEKKKKKKKKKKEQAQEETISDVETDVKTEKKKKKTKVENPDPEVNNSKNKLQPVSPGNIDSTEDDRETVKRTKLRESSKSVQAARQQGIRSATGENPMKSSTSIKRLPEDVLESLAEIGERPKKRRKVIKENQILPSKRMFSPSVKNSNNLMIDDDYVSLSSSGGTTQFGIVDLAKMTKKSKKTVALKSFRERMLARNPRQPVSAYLMYQQKQKASGKGQ